MKKADIVIKGGAIYTVNAAGDVAEAVAVQNNCIVFVGSEAQAKQYIGPSTRVIELHGGMALPGFIDCHTHPCGHIETLYSVDIYGKESVDEYLSTLKQYLADHPDLKFIYGFGWAFDKFDENGPQKEILDEVSEDIPILLYDEGFHSLWVNSKALKNVGITAETYLDQADIIRREGNEPTGVINELAILSVVSTLPDYEVDQFVDNFVSFQKLVHQYGVTTTFDACIYPKDGYPGFAGNNALLAYKQCAERSMLSLRYPASIVIDEEDYKDDPSMEELLEKYRDYNRCELFHIDAVKIYVDYWTEERLCKLAILADKLGYRLFLHALKAEETKRAIAACRAAYEANGGKCGRHTIAHVGVVDREDIPAFKELGINSVILPYWINCVEEFYGRTAEKLQNGDLDLTRTFIDQEIAVASGTAYPAVTNCPRPINGIQMGMTRRGIDAGPEEGFAPPASERATLDQMIRSFTIQAAYVNGMENITGSIETGKRADLVLLDKDLRAMSPDEIHRASEMMTIFDGQIVYERES